MTGLSIAARLAAVMVAVALAASALTVSLDYLKFRRVLRVQEDLVYQVVANDLAGAIEDGLNLGVSLNLLRTTEQLIQQHRAADSNTLSISVFDASGKVLFDTDQHRVGSKLPDGWQPTSRDANAWHADAAAAHLVGARLVNSFSQTAGGVVIRYDPAPLEARIRAVLLDMVRASLVMLTAVGVFAAVAAPLLTWPLRRWLAQASQELTRQGTDPVSPVGVALAVITTELREVEGSLMALGLGETRLETPHVE